MEFIDIHSHVLPALDDGARTLEQSINMLKIAQDEGIRYMIATPHNMPGKGCPSYTTIQERADKLQKKCEEEGISIRIFVGTEYFFREEVLELLEKEEVITLNGSEYILVEFDPSVEKMYFRNALRDVLANGYRPVVAHVERYLNIVQDLKLINDIKKMGALVQVNAASVIGKNGRQAKKDVKRLLKEGRAIVTAVKEVNQSGLLILCVGLIERKHNTFIGNLLLFLGLFTYSRNYYLALIVYAFMNMNIIKTIIEKYGLHGIQFHH